MAVGRSAGGIVTLHPAIAEARQTRTSLGRLLARIQMTEDTRDPVKQRAAQVRWRDHNAAKKAIYGG